MSSFSIARTIDRGGGRGRSYWLIASVAINLIFVGLILSWVLGMRAHQPLFGWQREIIGSLSPADAVVVVSATDRLEAVQTHTDQLLVEQYVALKASLFAEPFNAAECQKVLDQMAFIRDDQQIMFQRIFAEEVGGLSADGRHQLVDAMEREGRRWHPPWH